MDLSSDWLTQLRPWRSTLTVLSVLLATACQHTPSPHPAPKMTPGSGTRTLTGTSGVNAFVIDPQQHLLLATRLTQADFHWDNQPASSKVLLGTVLQPDHTGLKYFAVQGDPQAQLTIGGQPYTPGHPVSVQQGQPLWLSVQLSQAQSTGQLQLLWGERPEALTPIPEGLLLASPQSPEQQFTTQTIGLNQNIIENGDFERNTFWWYGDVAHRVSPGFNSQYALQVKPANHLYWYSFNGENLVRGSRYHLSYAVKSDGPADCKVSLSDQGYAFDRVTFTQAADFQQRSLDYVLPADAINLGVDLDSPPTNKGNCIYDAFRLTRVTEPPVVPEPAVNLVNNGEFDNLYALPTGWTLHGTNSGVLPARMVRHGKGAAVSLSFASLEQVIPQSALKPNTEYALKGQLQGLGCGLKLLDGTTVVAKVMPLPGDWHDQGTLYTTGDTVRDLTLVLDAERCQNSFDHIRFGPTHAPKANPTDPKAHPKEEDALDDLIPASDITAVIDPNVTPPTALAASEVSFSGSDSVGNDLKYHWDFGDGSSMDSDAEMSGDAVHTYAKPGYYTVTLTVTDQPTHTVKTTTMKLAILPELFDLISNRNLSPDQKVNFSIPYPVAGLSYEWSLERVPTTGPDLTPIPEGTQKGDKLSWKFDKTGYHTVTLRIYDHRQGVYGQDGPPLLSEQTTHLNVHAPKPIASFYVLGVEDPQHVIFTFDASASKSFIQSDSKLTYHWNFGDGTSEDSNSPQTKHRYDKDGNFVAELTVTDAAGNKEYSDKFLNFIKPIEHYSESYGDSYRLLVMNNFYSGKPPSKVSSLSLESSHRTVFSANTNPIFQKKNLFLQLFSSTDYYHIRFSQYNTYLNGDHFIGGEICNGGALTFSSDCRYPLEDGKIGGDVVHITPYLKDGLNTLSIKASTTRGINFSVDTKFGVFSKILIPKLKVNLVKDIYESSEPDVLSLKDSSGKNELLASLNISESHKPDDLIEFDLPIYTLDEQGNFIKDISGMLNIASEDNKPDVYIKDNIIVHGKGRLHVRLKFSELSNLQLDHLKTTDLDCDAIPYLENIRDGEDGFSHTRVQYCYDKNHITFEGFQYGFFIDNPLDTTSVIPDELLSNSDHFLASQSLSAYDDVLHSIPRTDLSLSDTRFQTLGLKDLISPARVDELLKRYDGSTAHLVVSLIPFVGNGTDLLIQAYNKATTGQADPVTTTLAALGLAMDAATPGSGDAVVPIKAIYQSGGMLGKAFMRGLVEHDLRHLNPMEVIKLLSTTGRFVKDIGFNTNGYQAIGNALTLAKEKSGSYLEAFKTFGETYAKFRNAAQATTKLSAVQWIKIAQFGLYAEHTGQVMAKCGEYCIHVVGDFNKFLDKNTITKTRGFGQLEHETDTITNRNIQNNFHERPADRVDEANWRARCLLVPNSFAGNTLVMTPSGLRMISTLQEGEQVLAYNEAQQANGNYPITQVIHHQDHSEIKLSLRGPDGQTEVLETTAEHPFYVSTPATQDQRPAPVGHEELNTHWVGAGHLQTGDKLKLADGQVGEVLNVTTLQKTQEMFNLSVQTAHTFYVGTQGWLVHNAKKDKDPCEVSSRLITLVKGIREYREQVNVNLLQFEKSGSFISTKNDFYRIIDSFGINRSEVSSLESGNVLVAKINDRGEVLIARNRSGRQSGNLPTLEHQLNGKPIVKIRYKP